MKRVEEMTLSELSKHADALVRSQTQLLMRIVEGSKPTLEQEFFRRREVPLTPHEEHIEERVSRLD